MRRTWPFIFLILFATMQGCGTGGFNGGEDYGDLLDTPDGLVLIEEEHIPGWGRSDCNMCHNLENIHLVDRIADVVIDIQAIHDLALEGGNAVCAGCHGTNGVP